MKIITNKRTHLKSETPIETGGQEAAESARPGASDTNTKRHGPPGGSKKRTPRRKGETQTTSAECANTRTSPQRAEQKEVASCEGAVQAASRHGTSEAAMDRENSDEEKAHAGPRAVVRNRREEAVQ